MVTFQRRQSRLKNVIDFPVLQNQKLVPAHKITPHELHHAYQEKGTKEQSVKSSTHQMEIHEPHHWHAC
jgi:hypothetical protein